MQPGGSQTLADYVIQFAKVGSSSLSTQDKAVLFNVAGIADFDATGDVPVVDLDDDVGEIDDTAEVFGALGIVARPLPPETDAGKSEHAETICLRLPDALVPIAVRDLRLKMGGNAPNSGTIALVGYGGGFFSMDPVNDGDDGTLQVIYCPYDYSGGVAQKAHAIILDPTSGNESIIITHAEGMAMTMSDVGGNKELVLKSSNGANSIIISDLGITLTGDITLGGSVVVGNPATAVPVLAGVASPPCSTLWLSP